MLNVSLSDLCHIQRCVVLIAAAAMQRREDPAVTVEEEEVCIYMHFALMGTDPCIPLSSAVSDPQTLRRYNHLPGL
eukprot:1160697-Pelagomonas_calceolata.AAC.1